MQWIMWRWRFSLWRKENRLRQGSIDGLYAFPHPFGCSQTGHDHAQTRKLLAALTRHPNAGAVLVVGRFSDMMGARGGFTTLTEVPEMFGADGFLLNRCAGEAVFEKAVNMINGFKNYLISHKETVYDDPSPGNRQGGIATLEDKSCGCVQKGGTAPTLKIASNSRLAEKKKGWIDFDAGLVADGESVEDAVGRLLQLVIRGGGQKTRTEELGFREISIFKEGITL